MGFDLEYIMVDCDHRLKDDLVFSSIERTDALVSEGSRYGEAVYGDTYGPDLYTFNNIYGFDGTFLEDSNGETVAIFTVQHTMAHSPQLYFQLPFEYERTALPQYATDVFQDVIHYGSGLYFGQEEDLYFGGPGYVTVEDGNDPDLTWFVSYEPTVLTVAGQVVNIPANSLVIKRFNNVYDWYLDYEALQAECPYCKGSGVKNDLVLRRDGKLSTIYDLDKLSQLVTKAVITTKGKNAFFPNYGTVIAELIGEKDSSAFLVRSQVVEQLEAIKSNQDYVSARNPELYNAREILEDITAIKLLPDTDPRRTSMVVTIINQALEQSASKTLRLK